MYPILESHSILILFFIHLGVSVIKIRCFSRILFPLRAIGKPKSKSKSNVYDHRSRRTKYTPSARSKKVLSITMPVLPDSSQLSFQHSVSSFLVLSVVVSRYCRPSISSRLVLSLSQFPVYISSSCESSWYECGVYWRIVSCLMSTVVVSWCRWRHICLWYSGYVGSSHGIVFSFEVWLKNQSTVLEAWGPRLAGGGIGYHVMERYTRMNAGLHRASITLQSGKVWHTDG